MYTYKYLTHYMHHKCPAGLAGVTTAPADPAMQGACGKGPREGPNLRINRHIKSSRSFSSYFLKLFDRCTVTWQVTQRYTAMQCEETLWAVVDPGGLPGPGLLLIGSMHIFLIFWLLMYRTKTKMWPPRGSFLPQTPARELIMLHGP